MQADFMFKSISYSEEQIYSLLHISYHTFHFSLVDVTYVK